MKVLLFVGTFFATAIVLIIILVLAYPASAGNTTAAPITTSPAPVGGPDTKPPPVQNFPEPAPEFENGDVVYCTLYVNEFYLIESGVKRKYVIPTATTRSNAKAISCGALNKVPLGPPIIF